MLALGFVAVNVVAFNQAWSMTHFSPSGQKTATPETLSFLQKVRVSLLGINLPRPINRIDPHSVGLDFETVRFGGADGAELEAWYIPCAKAKGLALFAHGYGTCKASLLNEAKAFHELGYAACLLDFHGAAGLGETRHRLASAKPTIWRRRSSMCNADFPRVC